MGGFATEEEVDKDQEGIDFDGLNATTSIFAL